MWLNLGCGSTPRTSGIVNVDIADLPNVDVVHDLDVLPWPWEDNSVARIIAQDIFEHVNNPVGFMTECHRVLIPGGAMVLKVPHFRHQDAFTDPTHKRFCTPHTWDYWIRGTELHKRHNAAYGGVSFLMPRQEVSVSSIFTELVK